MINYSIIIPHKNNLVLLKRCVASIPSRSDIQIIVVDDHSDNNNVPSKSFFNDSRVEVYLDFANKGAGYARNIGLQHATGKWVIFADCDDAFITNQLDNKLNLYLNAAYDLILFNVQCVDYESNNNIDCVYNSIINNKSKDYINICKFSIPVPWCKIIKRSLIQDNQITFDETPVANDAYFSLVCAFYSLSTHVDKDKIYKWYCFRQGSITSKKSKEAALIHFNCSVKRNRFMYEKGLMKYRCNLFESIPNLIRCGNRYSEALRLVISNTKTKYLIPDLIDAILQYVKNK